MSETVRLAERRQPAPQVAEFMAQAMAFEPNCIDRGGDPTPTDQPRQTPDLPVRPCALRRRRGGVPPPLGRIEAAVSAPAAHLS